MRVTKDPGRRKTSVLQHDYEPILPDRKRQAFLFRTDPELLQALRRWADDELRSANAQLEFILREALHRAGRLPQKTRTDSSPDTRRRSAKRSSADS